MVKFSPMHAYDYERVGVLLFKSMQVGYYVKAIDTSLGPEVEDDYFASKVRSQRKWSFYVEPIQTIWDVRGSYFTRVGELSIIVRLLRRRAGLCYFWRVIGDLRFGDGVASFGRAASER